MRSSRLPPSLEPNALTRAIGEIRRRGGSIIDLTESNPTRVGLSYPPDLLAPLGDAEGLTYEPQPLGLWSARAAVAADFRRRGIVISADRVAITASTSEAYAWLFKLWCDPGDAVLVPRPSYPLFEHLARLESIVAVPYDLDIPRIVAHRLRVTRGELSVRALARFWLSLPTIRLVPFCSAPISRR